MLLLIAIFATSLQGEFQFCWVPSTFTGYRKRNE